MNGQGLHSSPQRVDAPSVRQTVPGPSRLSHATYKTGIPIPLMSMSTDRLRKDGSARPMIVRTTDAMIAQGPIVRMLMMPKLNKPPTSVHST